MHAWFNSGTSYSYILRFFHHLMITSTAWDTAGAVKDLKCVVMCTCAIQVIACPNLELCGFCSAYVVIMVSFTAVVAAIL